MAIHMKESERGSFTRAAKPGESTAQHAERVLSNPRSSTKMKRKAAFAKAQRKWNRKTKRSSKRS